MTEKKGKRIFNIDLAKTVAIFCVILIHSIEGVWNMDIEGLMERQEYVNIILFGLYTIGRMGVPIFMALTGYLLLDRIYNREDIIRFWKRNLQGLFTAAEIWIFIYYMFSICLYKEKFQLGELIRELLFLKSSNANHLWYMGQIIGIYLFLPFIANILKDIDKKMIIFLIGISFAFTYVQTSVNVFRNAYGLEKISSQLNVSFSGGVYGILLILGWMIKKEYFAKIKTKILFAIFTISYLAIIYIQIFAYKHEIEYRVWYDSGLLVIAAMSLLLLILRFKKVFLEKWIHWIGYSSFALYLIHNIFRMYFRNKIVEKEYLIYSYREFLFLLVITILLSSIVTWLISKNKRIAKILFFMR